ncbi:MAG: hypothetical protein HQK54_11500 [Oligoflexales bacterium]|nr:hypothetical protein [Oligoflexales bacterium]
MNPVLWIFWSAFSLYLRVMLESLCLAYQLLCGGLCFTNNGLSWLCAALSVRRKVRIMEI